jgi:hypothetical protein
VNAKTPVRKNISTKPISRKEEKARKRENDKTNGLKGLKENVEEKSVRDKGVTGL